MSRPRIRTLKPEFFQDRELRACDLAARYLAVGLITRSDDRGRQRRELIPIQAHVYPDGDVPAKQLDGLLRALAWFVWEYAVGDLAYLWIPTFWRHQVISKPTESEHPAHARDAYASLPIQEALAEWRSRKDSLVLEDAGSSPGVLPDGSDPLTRVPFRSCSEEALEDQQDLDARDPILAAQQRLKSAAVVAVFDAWREATGHAGALLDDKRRRIIAAAIKRHGADDCLLAVKGWRHFAHNRGENDRHEPFNGLHICLGDTDHVEKFARAEAAGGAPSARPKAVASPKALAAQAAIERLCAEMPDWDAQAVALTYGLMRMRRLEITADSLRAYRAAGETDEHESPASSPDGVSQPQTETEEAA